jgi:hypothetical protein
MIGYGDSDTKWSRHAHRVARVPHRCGECGRTISPGEQYKFATGLSDDSIWIAKVCQHCLVAAEWLNQNCGGYLYHAIHEDFREHADGNLAMLRIVVGAGRRWRSFADPARLLPVPALPPEMNEHSGH